MTHPILRAFDSATYDAIQQYRVTDDALMPLAYQFANPNGRPYHNDWGVMGALSCLQPWQKIMRMDTAYRVPLPFKGTGGAFEKRWMLWDPSYPTSPGLQIEDRDIWDGAATQRLPHALIDCAVEGMGATTFSAWIGDTWRPVFTQYRRVIFGRLFAHYSGGLKQDVTVTPVQGGGIKSDITGWWDPPSFSWNKI